MGSTSVSKLEINKIGQLPKNTPNFHFETDRAVGGKLLINCTAPSEVALQKGRSSLGRLSKKRVADPFFVTGLDPTKYPTGKEIDLSSIWFEVGTEEYGPKRIFALKVLD